MYVYLRMYMYMHVCVFREEGSSAGVLNALIKTEGDTRLRAATFAVLGRLG